MIKKITNNSNLLKIGLEVIICSVVLAVIGLIIGLTSAPALTVDIIQIVVFAFCLVGSLLCYLSGHKKFLISSCIYLILFVLSIVLAAVNMSAETYFTIELILLLCDAIAKILILVGFKDINIKYNKNENINRIFIFVSIAFAIIRIVLYIIIYALPPEKDASKSSLLVLMNTFGILSEVFFCTVLALTHNAITYRKE